MVSAPCPSCKARDWSTIVAEDPKWAGREILRIYHCKACGADYDAEGITWREYVGRLRRLGLQ